MTGVGEGGCTWRPAVSGTLQRRPWAQNRKIWWQLLQPHACTSRESCLRIDPVRMVTGHVKRPCKASVVMFLSCSHRKPVQMIEV